MTRVDIDGVRLHYRVDGPERAPTLLLLHALGTDLRMWEPQMDVFGQRFRVVRFDGRAHGASDAPPGPYSIDELADDAIGLLDALGIERTCICGLSLGGLIGLRIATTRPERLERAVFACTAARIGSPEIWNERIDMVRAGGMAAITDIIVQRYFSEGFRDSRPDVVREAVKTLGAIPPDGYIECCCAVRDADFRSVVASIRVPSLIISATDDVATPPADGRWLHEQIPKSEFVLLERAAHIANIEQPRQFGDAVVDFLDPRPADV